MWSADELGATVECDESTGNEGETFDRLHDLAHYGFRPLARVLEDACEPADPLNKRRHIRLSKLLFEQRSGTKQQSGFFALSTKRR